MKSGQEATLQIHSYLQMLKTGKQTLNTPSRLVSLFTAVPLNSGYSQTLLGLLVCQLGQQGQESLGAQELQEHPVHLSHHDRPIEARYQIQ